MQIKSNPPIPPSIRVYQPKSISNDYVGEFGKLSTGYRQTIRLYGGWWTARWDMTNYNDSIKQNFFNRRIGAHIGVFDGGSLVWVGLIWEMELYQNGVLRRISLDKVRNAVKCVYMKTIDDTRNETSYYTNDGSIARYGRIEEIVYLDKTYLATAQIYAQTVLREQQWPLPRIVSVRSPKEDDHMQLRVSAVGYAHTINYKYLTLADVGKAIGDTNGLIDDAITTDAEFVSSGSLAVNAVSSIPPDTETKVWDWLMELAEIGDGTNSYAIQVMQARKLSYFQVGTTPTIFWDGKAIRGSTSRSSITQKYSVRPGILRDLTWPSSPLEATALLEDKRDSIVSEVEAGMDFDLPILKADDYNDSDLMSNLLQAEASLLEED